MFVIAQSTYGFAFIFAGEINGVDAVTHPIGYDGTGGALPTITIGIDPTSVHLNEMVVSVQNAVHTWNQLLGNSDNVKKGPNNNVPTTSFDFESVLIHEIGHTLGLHHPMLGTLAPGSEDYCRSTDGANNVFNVNSGTDGTAGSRDDLRGDDINLNWFKRANNNPFTLATPVDTTTYTRNGPLPAGHVFSEVSSRDVASTLYGLANTESVMVYNISPDNTHRMLGQDEVAGILYARAGLDEIQGNADDYTFDLEYVGFDASADIVIDFDDSKSAFANAPSSGTFLTTTHIAMKPDRPIYFNGTFNWFFNDILLDNVLIDFEDGALFLDSPSWLPFGASASITGTLTAANNHFGAFALEFTHDQSVDGFGGAFSSFFSISDWSAFDHIGYWVKSDADGVGNLISIEIRESSDEVWKQKRPFVMTEQYQKVETRLQANLSNPADGFVLASGFNNGILDLTDIDQVIFVFLTKNPKAPPKVLYFIDDVSLIQDDNPN